MSEDRIVISESEEERVTQIGLAVRDQLHDWLARFTAGVRYTPAVAHAVAEELILLACLMFIASDNHEAKRSDSTTEAHCRAVAAKLLAMLEAEVSS